jgi:RNA polymerase sigma-70 factor, ECF subfamily
MHNRTDTDLLRSHADGDSEAFGHLYTRHRDRLHRVASRIAGHDAEDALHDGMMRAYQHAGGFRGQSAVATWLHRIVVNAALDIVRRRPLVAEPDETAPSTEPQLSDWRHDVRRAGRVLTREQRQAILLMDVYGYPLHEASGILGVPPGTVKSRAARGRARLATRLAVLLCGGGPASEAVAWRVRRWPCDGGRDGTPRSQNALRGPVRCWS